MDKIPSPETWRANHFSLQEKYPTVARVVKKEWFEVKCLTNQIIAGF